MTLKRPTEATLAAAALKGHFRLGETAPQTAMSASRTTTREHGGARTRSALPRNP